MNYRNNIEKTMLKENLLQLDKSLTYIKVDGQTFLVRTGFRVKYNATCDDLKSISCQKIVHYGSKGKTIEHRIHITFKNRKLVKINWEDKNFKKMAQYFSTAEKPVPLI